MGQNSRANYRVNTTKEAKTIASRLLKEYELQKVTKFGLPEIDDRYHYWRVPILAENGERIGEIVIDARSSLVVGKKSTTKDQLEARLLKRPGHRKKRVSDVNQRPKISSLRNTIGLGDSEELLLETPAESVDLVFTSPPYFNARPEYADYLEYDAYLNKMQRIFHQCHRVLQEGRMIVVNVSPVLIRRASRNEASKRIAVPFDFHRILIEEGFDFIDDIIWVKPEGAGWATGRGRRFAADRNPMQYKPVPVTEYVLVYRKKTSKLIDWHIRKHPDKSIVEQSKIGDGYQKTNIWKIHPAFSKKHPAVFPDQLAQNVIRYYSFINDVVLDPFGGIGTTSRVAHKNGRRFVHYEVNPDYVEFIKRDLCNWYLGDPDEITWVNTEIPRSIQTGFK
ncbi:site-specific DNA-methyltransferase [bacterium]|nr:site-specific DNA-methyltransferase [bacterium]